MNRTRLRNRFLRTRSNRDTEAYNMQRIYCVSLSGKLSKSTATILIVARLPNNKWFWKYIKPLFTDKSSNSNKITLVEKYLILEKNNDIAETFNHIFTSVVSNLNIPHYQDPFIDSDQTENRIGHPILRIIEQYKIHSSIIAVNNQNGWTILISRNYKITNKPGNFKSW